jgi:crotonobetainyl-CoA:carnitine CoA-transferase CaiB-like acyl-CoA transferase
VTPVVGRDHTDAAAVWAASGAMWLTGRREGPPLGAPSGVVDVTQAAAERLRTMTSGIGRSVHVDGPALLGERAAIASLAPRGAVSCGGSTRLLRAADGWLAVALPRRDDLDLLPAWIGVDDGRAAWSDAATVIRQRRLATLVESAGELGLAVGALGERRGDDVAVIPTELGRGPAPVSTLCGLRVVDLSSLWAGPLCGQLLADAGMDVVKVEATGRIDGARHGPAAFFDLVNAGKSSVLVDLDERSGIEALGALVATADVVIESTRPRALAQLGIDAAAGIAGGGPRVWLSITAHGRRPPHDVRTGFGDDAAVAGGVVARDRRGPVFCADAVADPATGLLGAVAVVDRLLAGGRWLLDVALARVGALMAQGPTMAWDGEVATPRSRPRVGRAAPLGRDTNAVLDAIRCPS